MSITERGTRLIDLHRAPEILSVVNVWDAISTKVVTDLPQTKAVATAGHSIAATYGYPDGEVIPLDTHLDMIQRIVAAAGDVPVTADLEAGYGDAGETVRRAIGVGVVGANLEDRLRPLDESVAAVRAALAAAEAEGVPFALNARTDAFARGGDRDLDVIVADAIERGRAYVDAGATTVFVPGKLDAEVTARLVEGIGHNLVSVIGVPGALSSTEYEALGVARISYGPWTQRVALTAYAAAAESLYAGGVIDPATKPLN